MLSKCANPNCAATFRYLHEGKLYVIDVSSDFARSRSLADPKMVGTCGKREYYWLCSTCCRHMTIRVNRDEEVLVRQRRGSENGSEPAPFVVSVVPKDSAIR